MDVLWSMGKRKTQLTRWLLKESLFSFNTIIMASINRGGIVTRPKEEAKDTLTKGCDRDNKLLDNRMLTGEGGMKIVIQFLNSLSLILPSLILSSLFSDFTSLVLLYFVLFFLQMTFSYICGVEPSHFS